MADDLNPQWNRHLEAIADELLHLAVKAIDRIGPEETRKITLAIRAQLEQRRP